ncbi:hypothetical protein ACIGO6_20800 [Streptomyces sp. NPDC053750]|uniref:hypothetical protein n=1 Tax=Streptomyces sp. NPDC053750 TaxID=3365714 RepID=UPI0037D31E51
MTEGGPTERVRRYGTGLLSTEVYADGTGGYLWRRAPGPSARTPFTPVPAGLAAAIGALSQDGPGCCVLGREENRTRVYRVGGEASVAERALREGPGRGLGETLYAVGALLGRFHALPEHHAADSGLPVGSAGMHRLTSWWSGRTTNGRSATAAELLRAELGADNWRLAQRWLAGALADTRSMVVSHGAPTLGSVIHTGPDDEVHLLTGENLCLAPWYADLGWLVGELVELAWHHGDDHAQWQAALDALFEGYGRDLGAHWNRAAAVRIALHLHDYSAYVALNPLEIRRYASFLSHLITL